MLGARARAAELQAAKSAALRQRAHREAEDHFLPPQSAPVSLTDFTRDPIQSKNKGVKAFRPLINSDFAVTQSQTESQLFGSERLQMDDVSPVLPPAAAPLAPRAMLNRSDSFLPKMTPSKARVMMFTPRSQNAGMLARAVSEYDVSGMTFDSPSIDTVQNTVGYVFGPDDLSPSKQEAKFLDMRQQHTRPHSLQTPIDHLRTSFVPDAADFAPQQRFNYGPHFQYTDINSLTDAEVHLHDRLQPQHYVSEAEILAMSQFSDQNYIVQRHLDRTQTFADDLADHQHQIQQYANKLDHSYPPRPVLNDNQPYDRNTKMQSFVAAQQAIAKKGKTVLHNPELYRSAREKRDTHMSTSVASIASSDPEYQPLTASNIGTLIMESEHGGLIFDEHEKVCVGAAATQNSGEELHSSRRVLVNELENDVVEPSDDSEMYHLRQELTSSICEILQPVTIRERERMLFTFRRLDTSCGYSTNLFADPITIVGNRAQQCSSERSVPKSARHTAALKVIKNHEKRKNQSSEYGVIGRPVSRNFPDLSSRGALRAIVGVMATLYDRSEDYKDNREENPYTPAPSYAVVENDTPGSYFSAPRLIGDQDSGILQSGI